MGVPTFVVAGSAEGEQDDALRSCVNELAAYCRADPCQAVWAKHVLDAFKQQGQFTLEHAGGATSRMPVSDSTTGAPA
ncbi:MAG: hypothetical protein ABSG95_10455 [Solirubrobacteraceae bacterium]